MLGDIDSRRGGTTHPVYDQITCTMTQAPSGKMVYHTCVSVLKPWPVVHAHCTVSSRISCNLILAVDTHLSVFVGQGSERFLGALGDGPDVLDRGGRFAASAVVSDCSEKFSRCTAGTHEKNDMAVHDSIYQVFVMGGISERLLHREANLDRFSNRWCMRHSLEVRAAPKTITHGLQPGSGALRADRVQGRIDLQTCSYCIRSYA
jgi:hypothetical protein